MSQENEENQQTWNPVWIRKKMGHLLLHLYTRNAWQNQVVSNAIKRNKEDGFEMKGLTDLQMPSNWAIYQEKNTISFILGKPFEGDFNQALQEIEQFVYSEEKPKPFMEIVSDNNE